MSKPQRPPPDIHHLTKTYPEELRFLNAHVFDFFFALRPRTQRFLIFLLILFVVVNITFFRLALILAREKPTRPRPKPSPSNPTHLLIVLGSGGHTAEMLNILETQKTDLCENYTFRTYVVSSGDGFSAGKAKEFEEKVGRGGKYEIVTVRRARRVHQGVITAPVTTVQCFWDCLAVLQGSHPDSRSEKGYPDLILTNGPGTGVCVVLASILLLFFGVSGPVATGDGQKQYVGAGQMRTIFIESWARVKTLSLSGKILKPFVDRFLVQWDQLKEKEGGKVEFLGPLVS